VTTKHWFAVRTIFCHGKTTQGKAIYEEKISTYLATDSSEAQRAAEADATRYIQLNDRFIQLKTYEIFALGHTESDLNGQEV